MAAVPYTGILILKGVQTNKLIHMPMTFSDVTTEFATFSDGSDSLQLNSDQGYAITDLINSVGGTDTTQVEIFKNNLTSSIVVVPKANLNTSNNRQFQGNAVGFEAGSRLKFKQLT